jgi:hypothetical protein
VLPGFVTASDALAFGHPAARHRVTSKSVRQPPNLLGLAMANMRGSS